MFEPKTYKNRRERLHQLMNGGIALFLGNDYASMNYPANFYHFRQDSNFLYYFALNHDNFAGVLDFDENKDIIFGNDVTMDDIIWMGQQPSVKDQAALAGVQNTMPMDKLGEYIQDAIAKGRKIHILPPYRGDQWLKLEGIFGMPHGEIKQFVSQELIEAVVAMKSIKEECEIVEIEKAVDIAYDMHTTAMKMCKPGVVEMEIAGAMEGIALANGGPVSFPIILSIDGQTLHNHYHGNTLVEGRMMVADAGAETTMNYSSDITRTTPVGGKFNQRQKEIYQIVYDANEIVIRNCKPGLLYRDMHLLAAKTIAQGLSDIGLMKGDVDEAVKQGAHALFFPHGLGHMMGMDVHDMEGLGENNVGYNKEITRSDQFGLAFLRMGRKLETGFVMTDEPGIYFISALIDQWKAEGKFTDFINYEKVESYKDFGGIRLEDDLLITEDGCRVLGKPIPKSIAEVEETCNS